MKATSRVISALVVAAGAMSLGACSNMSPTERDTAIGAGVGAVAGSVLSNGSGVGTVGGAVVGGVIGNEVGKRR